jgi:hypothetical protein
MDGVAFPQRRGWVAVLTVSEPLQALQAYVQQAAQHGFTVDVQCAADFPRGRSYTQLPLDDSTATTARAQALSCEAHAGDGESGRWRLFLHWGTLYDRSITFTSAVMEYQPFPSLRRPVRPPRTPQKMPAMIDWRPPQVVGTGRRFDGDFTGVTLRVADGSQLVAPVADNGCTTGGFAAVLRATGPGDVASAYTKQFADNGFPPGPAERLPGGDGAVFSEGSDVSLTRLTKNGVRWLLIQRCND